MAPSFPLSMPLAETQWTMAEFALQRQVAGGRLRSGAAQRIDLGTPYWRVDYRSIPLTRAQYDELVSWLETLAYGVNAFLAFDVHKPYPRQYLTTGWTGLVRAGTATAFDGTATLDVINATTTQVSGLPANFQMRAGDWIGYVEGGKYALHRMQEDKAANASGVMGPVYHSPAPLSTVFTTSAVVHFDRPKAEMLIDPETVSAPWAGDSRPVIAFSAAQKVM